MGRYDDDYEDEKDLIPGDNSQPSPFENYRNAPINLTRIPSESGSGSINDVPIERPVAG